MPAPTFLQIHTLTSYPGTLLNRDDAGFAKRLPFGGATRTRVSSQCLKYHWRNFDGKHALYDIDLGDGEAPPRSLRSRETFRRRIARPLIEADYPAHLVRAITASFKTLLLGESSHLDSKDQLKKSSFNKFLSPDTKEGETENEKALHSSQVTIFGLPEVKYVRGLVRNELDYLLEDSEESSDGDAASDEMEEAAYDRVQEYFKKRGKRSETRENLRGLMLASGLDASLFGRMATSDVLARGDAAVHVAHAFTTHEEESESDYFSAVDELRRDEPGESGELGAGHINSQELTSGLFYGYVVVDLPLLVSNLEGVERENWQNADKTLTAQVLRRLIYLVSTVSPGAKLGSTAPHSYAQCVFAESGAAQPRTLANAFQDAVSTNGQGVLAGSYDALGSYVSDMDDMYGVLTDRRLAAMGDGAEALADQARADERVSVSEIADWAAQQINGQTQGGA